MQEPGSVGRSGPSSRDSQPLHPGDLGRGQEPLWLDCVFRGPQGHHALGRSLPWPGWALTHPQFPRKFSPSFSLPNLDLIPIQARSPAWGCSLRVGFWLFRWWGWEAAEEGLGLSRSFVGLRAGVRGPSPQRRPPRPGFNPRGHLHVGYRFPTRPSTGLWVRARLQAQTHPGTLTDNSPRGPGDPHPVGSETEAEPHRWPRQA